MRAGKHDGFLQGGVSVFCCCFFGPVFLFLSAKPSTHKELLRFRNVLSKVFLFTFADISVIFAINTVSHVSFGHNFWCSQMCRRLCPLDFTFYHFPVIWQARTALRWCFNFWLAWYWLSRFSAVFHNGTNGHGEIRFLWVQKSSASLFNTMIAVLMKCFTGTVSTACNLYQSIPCSRRWQYNLVTV